MIDKMPNLFFTLGHLSFQKPFPSRNCAIPIDLVVGAGFTLPFKDVMKWLVTEESRTSLRRKMANRT